MKKIFYATVAFVALIWVVEQFKLCWRTLIEVNREMILENQKVDVKIVMLTEIFQSQQQKLNEKY